MATTTIADLDRDRVQGQRVLVRVDFNVPLDDRGAVADDRRIRMAVPTIRSIVDRGGRAVLMSHLGRPAGRGVEPGLSLRPAADRLAELLEAEGVAGRVHFAEGGCTSPGAERAVHALADGETLVLENLRFEPGEKAGDAAFAAELAGYGDVYCNDAFGTAHRSDASMVAVPCAMDGRPRVAGLLLARELEFLSARLERAVQDRAAGRGRFVAILGGAKVSDKAACIRHLTGRVDAILVGGAMAYTFLRARGTGIGASRYEADLVDDAAAMLRAAEGSGTTILLPEDHVTASSFDDPTDVAEQAGDIPAGRLGLDIGPATRTAFVAAVADATTIVWNGPMGVFERPPFDAGTNAVAEAVAARTGTGDEGPTTIVGGGDTAAAVEAAGLADRFSHVSTGGGASLAMLEGRRFESVELLDRR